MKKAAVWISDDSYVLPTFLSIASFVSIVEDIPVILFYYGTNIITIQEMLWGLSRNITVYPYNVDFVVHDYNEKYRCTIINRIARMRISAILGKDTLIFMFDSDTVFAQNIKLLIVQISGEAEMGTPTIWGNIEYERALDNYLFFARKDTRGNAMYISDQRKIELYRHVYGDTWNYLLNSIQFNNGVLIFLNFDEIAKIWERLYLTGLQYEDVNPEDDQVPLAVATRISGCRATPIDDQFNSKGAINGDFAVFHAYAGRWKNEVMSAIVDNDNLSDYARIASHFVPIAPADIVDKFRINGPSPYRYLSIFGYFEYEDLYVHVLSQIERGHIVEIGTHKGRSTCFMAELIKYAAKDIAFDSIDCFRITPLEEQEAWKNMIRAGVEKYVNIISTSSYDASKRYEDHSIDFLFINGDHSYECVLNDLSTWYPKVKHGGIIAGDDYNVEDRRNLGVRRAVDEFCRESGLVQELWGKCFIFRKP